MGKEKLKSTPIHTTALKMRSMTTRKRGGNARQPHSRLHTCLHGEGGGCPSAPATLAQSVPPTCPLSLRLAWPVVLQLSTHLPMPFTLLLRCELLETTRPALSGLQSHTSLPAPCQMPHHFVKHGECRGWAGHGLSPTARDPDHRNSVH